MASEQTPREQAVEVLIRAGFSLMDSGAAEKALAAAGLLPTETEWGVLYEATADTTLYEPRDSEAVARTETAASPTDTAVIRRDVTAWRRADARP